MQNVNKQLDQLSGHLEIIAVPIPNISSIEGPLLYCHDLNANYFLHCSKESINYSAASAYSKPGIAIGSKVSAFIRGRSSENDLILEYMLRYRYIVVLKNSTGEYSRIGDNTKGLSFSFEPTSSADPSGALGYNIAFSGDTLSGQKPVIYPFSVKS